jgi:hypothetical protein
VLVFFKKRMLGLKPPGSDIVSVALCTRESMSAWLPAAVYSVAVTVLMDVEPNEQHEVLVPPWTLDIQHCIETNQLFMATKSRQISR